MGEKGGRGGKQRRMEGREERLGSIPEAVSIRGKRTSRVVPCSEENGAKSLSS